MAVTRSRSVERAGSAAKYPRRRAGWRSREFLLPASWPVSLVAAGLYLVHKAKSQALAEIEHGLAAKQLLNLNELGAREDLLPALAPFFPKTARARGGGAQDLLPHRQPARMSAASRTRSC